MQSKVKIYEYLNKIGLNNEQYNDFISSYVAEDTAYTLCTINGFDFIVSHFFDETEENGYGLIPTNNLLRFPNEGQLAIGLIEGDDVICLNIKNGEVGIFMIQTGDGEYIKVADSLNEFLEKAIIS